MGLAAFLTALYEAGRVPVEAPQTPLDTLDGDSDGQLRAFDTRAREQLAYIVPEFLPDVLEPEDLRLGGVSDIANRGPLDRLLTSELAHDDLMLAVRVAVGEALYLRREAPPRTPVRERHVLIDCGIRLWGVPRVFAAAVGLALAATADRHATTSAWRTKADDVEPVNLGTREGLISLLEQLEAAPQPAAALHRFFDEVDRTSAAADAILITHEDVLADADFRRAIAEMGDRQFYIATVDRFGRFRLRVHCGRGTKTVREAEFDLQRLLTPANRPAARLNRPDSGSDLPAILSVEPFPLLLPHQIDLERTAFHPQYGAVANTHDGRLMHWRKAGLGAAQLTASVPAGALRHLSIDGEGVVRLVAGGGPRAPLRLLRASLSSGEVRLLKIDAELDEPLSVVREREVLYLIAQRAIRVVSDEGRVTPELRCRFKHAGARFFTSGVWYALSFDGQLPRLTRVPVHPSISLGSIAAMFEIDGRDGPCVITHEGRVACTIDGVNLWDGFANGRITVSDISECGRRLVLQRSGERFYHQLLFLGPYQPPRVETCHTISPMAYLLQPGLKELLCHNDLRWKFRLVGIDPRQRLTLMSRHGDAFPISPAAHGPPAVVFSLAAAPPTRVRQFEAADGPPGVGFRLRIARWADGSRAWLDSRGLLHLKSSDRRRPELTIVLAYKGELAAWASDGRRWGPRFYTDMEPGARCSGAELLGEIEAFIAELE